MSRGDYVSVAVTLLGSGIVYFVGGRTAFLLCLFTGVFIILAIHLIPPKTAEQKGESLKVQDSFNPSVAQNPTFNVTIGPHPSVPTRAPAMPRPETKPEPKPNVKFLKVRTTRIEDGPHGRFLESPSEMASKGLVACFRNEPIFQTRVPDVIFVAAHLVYRDESGQEIGEGVSHACWVDEGDDVVDLRVEQSKCVILM